LVRLKREVECGCLARVELLVVGGGGGGGGRLESVKLWTPFETLEWGAQSNGYS